MLIVAFPPHCDIIACNSSNGELYSNTSDDSVFCNVIGSLSLGEIGKREKEKREKERRERKEKERERGGRKRERGGEGGGGRRRGERDKKTMMFTVSTH